MAAKSSEVQWGTDRLVAEGFLRVPWVGMVPEGIPYPKEPCRPHSLAPAGRGERTCPLGPLLASFLFLPWLHSIASLSSALPYHDIGFITFTNCMLGIFGS